MQKIWTKNFWPAPPPLVRSIACCREKNCPPLFNNECMREILYHVHTIFYFNLFGNPCQKFLDMRLLLEGSASGSP